MRAAAPMPPPTHMVQMPRGICWRCMCCSMVQICRAPVQPRGWPRAMAPPQGLTWEASRSSLRMQATAWAAKASLSSITPMSCSETPV